MKMIFVGTIENITKKKIRESNRKNLSVQFFYHAEKASGKNTKSHLKVTVN